MKRVVSARPVGAVAYTKAVPAVRIQNEISLASAPLSPNRQDETRTITPTTYWPFSTERPFTETRLAPQLDPGTNVVRIATLPMPAILVRRRPA